MSGGPLGFIYNPILGSYALGSPAFLLPFVEVFDSNKKIMDRFVSGRGHPDIYSG